MNINEFSARPGQSLIDHLEDTAKIAETFTLVELVRYLSVVAGKWHDLGKYTDAFQRRLRGSRERVDHSSAGAQMAVQVYNEENLDEYYIGRILAYVIAGHHTGLPDGNSAEESCLDRRLKKDLPPIVYCPEQLLLKYPVDIKDFREHFKNCRSKKSLSFSLSFLIRMVFSCLVDADRLNAEESSSPGNTLRRHEYPPLTELPDKLRFYLEHLSKSADKTPVNQCRADVLNQCLEAAYLTPGFFSLTVPTGGGKTLSSLAFALNHALHHKLDRILYVIPYTSIIEQNARVFRNCLGDDAVLEHHSNFELPPTPDDEAPPYQSLASENWDAPVIVTTNVQFFESLFSHSPYRCRKLHNLTNSVIILDEAQMLPPERLRPCLEVLRELVERYRATVVLCTATQPALTIRDGFPAGLDAVREIIAEPHALYESLQRVQVEYLGKVDKTILSETLLQHDQVLSIVNTRNHARELFELLPGSAFAYHLSASMCPAHRTHVLEEIRSRLKRGLPCRVISTQLIEAGVDIDFPFVYREISGLDSIAQAAGRCNREGRLPLPGRVYVYEWSDGIPFLFRQPVQATRDVLRTFREDMLALDAVHRYFQIFYWQKGKSELDKYDVMNRMTEGGRSVTFPFREIGESFRLIDEDLQSLIIPWGTEGEALVEALRAGEPSRALTRKAQRFTVSVFRKHFERLDHPDTVEMIHGIYAVLVRKELYHPHLGLLPFDSEYDPNSR